MLKNDKLPRNTAKCGISVFLSKLKNKKFPSQNIDGLLNFLCNHNVTYNR